MEFDLMPQDLVDGKSAFVYIMAWEMTQCSEFGLLYLLTEIRQRICI